MNPLDFFDPSKEMKPLKLHLSARKEFLPLSNLDRSLSLSSLAATIASGTDYVDEYIKQADQELFESSKLLRAKHGKYDDVSLATVPEPDECMLEEQGRIYKHYNIAYKSKANLTIKTVQENIIDSIRAEPVTIIQGPTGCGKTTQVPQIILSNCCKEKLFCNIVVTQPRRIAAISIAKRVSSELNCPLGSLVGYKVGLASCTSVDTRLVYCTTGVLLQKLITTKTLNDYTHIVIDEIHERDQEMDFLLLVIRKLLHYNSHSVKIILMSATFQVEKFAKYFASYVGDTLAPAHVVDVTKRNYFNVKDYYLDELGNLGSIPYLSFSEPNVSEDIIDFACRLMVVMDSIDMNSEYIMPKKDNKTRPTILVFLPGIHEIEEMHTALSNPKYAASKWDIVVLHSSITNEEQQLVFQPTSDGCRRVILSTNIAESSITVPDVKYVIDFCLTKQLTTDHATNYQMLELTWASKSNCQQRAGRTGRVMDGRVYRMIPKHFYIKLPSENPPEIVKAPLENVVLRSKLLDMGKPQALLALALDPPDLSHLERTVILLKEVGGLLHIEEDPFDGEITDLGHIMATLPIDIHISKMIVLGHVFNVLREAIIIGASMAVKNMFSTPFQRKLESYKSKLIWAGDSCSDGVSFLNAYTVWQREKMNKRIKSDSDEKAWANRNHLQVRVLREVVALIAEITGRLKQLGIKETFGDNKVSYKAGEKDFVLKVIFAGGFYPHYFLTKSTSDESMKMRMLGGSDPLKTVYLQGWPNNQPVMLYAKRFQDAFACCMPSDEGKNISVKFDSTSRVYIHFGSDVVNDQVVEKPGEIPTAVYKALKMRKIGTKIVIPIMDAESVMNRVQAKGIDTNISTLFFRNCNRAIPPNNEIRPHLPGLKTSDITLHIIRSIDPKNFWARIESPSVQGYFKQIKDYIYKMQKEGLRKFESLPKIGSPVLAPATMHQTTEFHRGVVRATKIANKDNILAEVYFVDYGFINSINVCDLGCLPEGHPLISIPGLAIQCVLANINPSVKDNLAGQWSNAAHQTFQVLVTRNVKELRAKIYSVIDSIVALTLISVTQDDIEININEHLIKEGFAVHDEEACMSKANNELRKQNDRLSSDDIEYHNEKQYDQNIQEYADPPGDDLCHSTVTLRGPYSPLEVNVASLNSAGIGRKAGIDDCSVNSILLDHTLVNPPERLLIAGSVSQGAISNNLHLRNTTLMPSLPGLVSLLCLIFAPQIELRRNKYGTRYTGALCGLGYNKKTKESLCKKHDMHLHFDYDISIDDLSDINRLRHYMSTGIAVTSEDNENVTENTIQCQNKVKQSFFKIIEKHRVKIAPDLEIHRDNWCLYDSDMFLKPGSFANIKRNIFKLHWALDLKEKDEMKEAMIEHLQNLKDLAGLSYKEDTGEIIRCKLCNQNVFGIIQLRTHITSKQHRSEENRILHR